jgi:hypothetical protein
MLEDFLRRFRLGGSNIHYVLGYVTSPTGRYLDRGGRVD